MSTVSYPNAQAIFYQQYESARRDEVVGILLVFTLIIGPAGIAESHGERNRSGRDFQACLRSVLVI